MGPDTAITAPIPFPSTRRWPRLKINVPIRVILPRDGRVMIIEGRGNELNEGGMQIFAGVELRVGDTVEVEFTPPYHGMPIRTRSIIRDRRGYYYGIEFLHHNADDERKIVAIRQALQSMGSPIH
jgi:hypothetical protein